MSDHEAVRNFIRDVVLSIRDDASFFYARESDFNAIKNKPKGIKVLLLPLKHDDTRVEDSFATNRDYKVTLLIFDFDKLQGSEVETQGILDRTDVFLRQLQAKLNLKSLDSEAEADLTLGTDQITIANESIDERIKFTSDMVTGWEYNLTMTVPDQLNYCDIYD